MTKPRFDPTINLGHILTIMALLGSVFIAYVNIVRSVDNHELRIAAMEKKSDRDLIIQQQILDALSTIREDIATLKAQSRLPHR